MTLDGTTRRFQEVDSLEHVGLLCIQARHIYRGLYSLKAQGFVQSRFQYLAYACQIHLRIKGSLQHRRSFVCANVQRKQGTSNGA